MTRTRIPAVLALALAGALGPAAAQTEYVYGDVACGLPAGECRLLGFAPPEGSAGLTALDRQRLDDTRGAAANASITFDASSGTLTTDSLDGAQHDTYIGADICAAVLGTPGAGQVLQYRSSGTTGAVCEWEADDTASGGTGEDAAGVRAQVASQLRAGPNVTLTAAGTGASQTLTVGAAALTGMDPAGVRAQVAAQLRAGPGATLTPAGSGATATLTVGVPAVAELEEFEASLRRTLALAAAAPVRVAASNAAAVLPGVTLPAAEGDRELRVTVTSPAERVTDAEQFDLNIVPTASLGAQLSAANAHVWTRGGESYALARSGSTALFSADTAGDYTVRVDLTEDDLETWARRSSTAQVPATRLPYASAGADGILSAADYARIGATSAGLDAAGVRAQVAAQVRAGANVTLTTAGTGASQTLTVATDALDAEQVDAEIHRLNQNVDVLASADFSASAIVEGQVGARALNLDVPIGGAAYRVLNVTHLQPDPSGQLSLDTSPIGGRAGWLPYDVRLHGGTVDVTLKLAAATYSLGDRNNPDSWWWEGQPDLTVGTTYTVEILRPVTQRNYLPGTGRTAGDALFADGSLAAEWRDVRDTDVTGLPTAADKAAATAGQVLALNTARTGYRLATVSGGGTGRTDPQVRAALAVTALPAAPATDGVHVYLSADWTDRSEPDDPVTREGGWYVSSGGGWQAASASNTTAADTHSPYRLPVFQGSAIHYIDQTALAAAGSGIPSVTAFPANPHNGSKVDLLQQVTEPGSALLTAEQASTGLTVGWFGSLGRIDPAPASVRGVLYYLDTSRNTIAVRNRIIVVRDGATVVPTKVSFSPANGAAVEVALTQLAAPNDHLFAGAAGAAALAADARYRVTLTYASGSAFTDKVYPRGQYTYTGLAGWLASGPLTEAAALALMQPWARAGATVKVPLAAMAVWTGTRAAYNALTADAGTLYFVSE